MNHAKTYRTRQQNAILRYMEETESSCITVGQVEEYLKTQGEPVGLTTIYRHLNRFQKEGIIQKVAVDGYTQACYQYVGKEREQEGFLLKCEDCGNMINMGCEHMAEFYGHVLEEHHFSINPVRTIFYGRCDKCLAKGNY